MTNNKHNHPNPEGASKAGSPSVMSNGSGEIQTGRQKLITRKEVADYLQVSIQSIVNYTNRGLLTAYKIGRHIRYNEAEVIAAVQSNAVNHEFTRNHSHFNHNEND